MADAMDVDTPAVKPESKVAVAKGKAAGGKEGGERFQVKKVSVYRLIQIFWIKSDSALTDLQYWPSQWNAVALWAWDIVVDNCAICRNHIMDHCQYHR